jgi:hypothetical protein
MKSIVFDAGPVISFTTNNLLWLLEKLKQKFRGEFYITSGVHYELIRRPLETKKFKFEALQVERLVEKKVLSVLKDETIESKSKELLNLANSTRNPDAIVVDERITRLLIENPEGLKSLLERRLHTKVTVDKNKLNSFKEITRHVSLIRSVELVAIAYELGLLNEYLVNVPNAKRELLESVLWGVKLNGCSVSEEEINQIMNIEL